MTRFERRSVLVTTLLVFVTGVAYALVKYLMEPSEPWAVINHPVQPWLLKAHILVAPLLVFAVGMIAVRHVWQHFRRGMVRGRRSGLTAMLTLAPMVVTGYLIQAVTAEGWLLALAVAHIATGVLYSAGVAVHAVLAPRRGAAAGTRGRAARPAGEHEPGGLRRARVKGHRRNPI